MESQIFKDGCTIARWVNVSITPYVHYYVTKTLRNSFVLYLCLLWLYIDCQLYGDTSVWITFVLKAKLVLQSKSSQQHYLLRPKRCISATLLCKYGVILWAWNLSLMEENILGDEQTLKRSVYFTLYGWWKLPFSYKLWKSSLMSFSNSLWSKPPNMIEKHVCV
jgi:hypothetical protein